MPKLAIGEFSVLELLKHHHSSTIRIIVKSKDEEKKYIAYKKPIIVNKNYINKVVKKEDVYALAEFNEFSTALNKNKTHIVISNLDNEGEIGTILRTCVAFDFFDVALINCKVDLFSSKLIRASTGAFFMVNVECFKNKNEYLSKYKNKYIEFINENYPLSLTVGAKLYKFNQH